MQNNCFSCIQNLGTFRWVAHKIPRTQRS